MLRADAKIAELRAMYEPYLTALSTQFFAPLPPWIHPHEVRENWRTSAWERISQGTRSAAGPGLRRRGRAFGLVPLEYRFPLLLSVTTRIEFPYLAASARELQPSILVFASGVHRKHARDFRF
jgi:hypothetical protein